MVIRRTEFHPYRSTFALADLALSPPATLTNTTCPSGGVTVAPTKLRTPPLFKPGGGRIPGGGCWAALPPCPVIPGHPASKAVIPRPASSRPRRIHVFIVSSLSNGVTFWPLS